MLKVLIPLSSWSFCSSHSCFNNSWISVQLNVCPYPRLYDLYDQGPFKKNPEIWSFVFSNTLCKTHGTGVVFVWSCFVQLRRNEGRECWIFWIISSIKMKLTLPAVLGTPCHSLSRLATPACRHLERQGRPLIKKIIKISAIIQLNGADDLTSTGLLVPPSAVELITVKVGGTFKLIRC